MPKEPLCPKCSEPMTYLTTITATKGAEKLKLKIYTCPTDKTFSHTQT